MCGRFYRHRSPQKVAAEFGAVAGDHVDERAGAPSYNIPPSRDVLAVRYNAKHEERTLDALHWGLIPHFAKDRKFAFRTSNARAEGVDTKPSFRGAFQKRRCIVPLDGFYEWWTDPARKKHPFAFAMRDQHLFGVAGLWENWMDPETGEWVRSVALVTTEANEVVGRIHDRMPVILHAENYAAWLGEETATPEQLKKLLRPYPAREMVTWPVDPRMNRPNVDEVSLLDPLERDPLATANSA